MSRSPSATTSAPVTLIAYGSLMSGFGLASLGPLAATDAGRVKLPGCRRGFGKLSRHGDHFAKVLEPPALDAPVRAEPIAPDAPVSDAPEGIALTIPLATLLRITFREGYPKAALEALIAAADAAGATLPEYLWQVLERAGFDCVGYRRALAATTGTSSVHYIPHPVARPEAPPALVFLAPGAEGSGDDAHVPIRVQSAMTRLLSLREAWRYKPNVQQLDYFLRCLLAEAHNVSCADLYAADLREDPPLANRVRAALAAETPSERARFLEIVGIDTATYETRFQSGPPRAGFLFEG